MLGSFFMYMRITRSQHAGAVELELALTAEVSSEVNKKAGDAPAEGEVQPGQSGSGGHHKTWPESAYRLDCQLEWQTHGTK